ncbi:MAG: hypothetical protein AABW59_01085 [archaeon]
MIPEAELIRKELTIRQMDFPSSVALTKNSLLRWCALSLGLISSNESRDKGLLALDALFTFIFTKKQNPTTLDIQEYIMSKSKVEMSEKLIRYHLNRVIDLGLIQREGLSYKINPSPTSEQRNSMKESFNAWVKDALNKEMEKTSGALDKLQKMYEEKK